MVRKSAKACIAVVATAAVFAAPALAEEEQLPDRFMLRVGRYHTSSADTIARLDSNSLPAGVYIDFPETLGSEDSGTVVRVDGRYRFNDKHGLGFSWYALRFNGNKVLEKDITWGDQTFVIGTTIESEIKFDVYKLNYQYSLFHNSEAELGVLFGFHVMRASLGLGASGLFETRSESVTAPLPVVGLFADYKFTPRFSAYYNYQAFLINYQDKVKGGLQDFLLGLEYRVTPHVALGAAFNRFGLHLQSKEESTTLYVDTNWNGTMLYGSVYF